MNDSGRLLGADQHDRFAVGALGLGGSVLLVGVGARRAHERTRGARVTPEFAFVSLSDGSSGAEHEAEQAWTRRRLVTRARVPLLLGGCVVSFDDYPVGHLDGAPSSGSGAFAGDIGAGGTGKGGAGSGGTAGLATGGSSLGGTGAVVGVGGEKAGAETSTVESDPNLIDDFEDGDDAILTSR